MTTVKIVSDLPLSGDGRAQTQQMVRAIRFVLQQANFKAGNYRVQFESHDDALAATGEWDEGRCSHNARAFVADPARRRRHRHVQLGLLRCSRSRS